jgi:DNA-binding CsgD family transcriptional regulator
MNESLPGSLQRLPLIGRSDELAALGAALERARAGSGSAILVVGEAGTGKSRLMSAAVEDARRRGWEIAYGRAYPVETEIPYAVFSDAFVPFLQKLDAGGRSLLGRGGDEWMSRLFAAFGAAASSPGESTPSESRVQLFWNFARFLTALGARRPLLVALDDLHAADVSSIELFHFLARQVGGSPVAFVATVVGAEGDGKPALRALIQSLASLDLLTTLQLQPLSPEHTDALVRELFGADPSVTREFTALLYGWTRGNPFFLEQTLKGLIESGRLRREGTGWLGWELSELHLPPSVREAVLLRLGVLSRPAREVAELAAVIGNRARWSDLRALVDLPEDAVVEAIEECRRANVLAEVEQGGEVSYDFRHPMLRETLLGEIGLIRRRKIHGRVAETLEARYGDAAIDHAEELAAHFVRAGEFPGADRAVRYFAAAGRRALSRFADREAAAYLGAALARARASGRGEADHALDPFALLVDLARAKQRLGDFADALGLLEQARGVAEARADQAGVALTLRRAGLSLLFSGHVQRALGALAGARDAAERSGQDELLCRVHLAHSACRLAVGDSSGARASLHEALQAAERVGTPGLSARVHRGLLLFHTVTGPPDAARSHGERAIELATSAGDRAGAGSCHWAMAVLEGLNARVAECARHVAAAHQLADAVGSPLLQLAIDEIEIQHAYSRGDWGTGLALGERAIALARALHQRSMLPRLLTWTSLIHVGRDEIARAKSYLDEAWELTGGGESPDDVHSAVTVHIGIAHYHLMLGDYARAVEVGERGLALVDRTGYRAWAVHRLLPTISEAYLHLRDLEGARRVNERLRRDAGALQHRLGLAWADSCDAVVAWLAGEVAEGAVRLRRAAEGLEEIPYVSDAARVRRQLAGRLADLGDREGALRELRHVHDVFLRLGAVRELEKARVQFQELGARPPVRAAGAGPEGLTGREAQIVRLVGARLSNKAIGKELGISARTVGTHLSNIFKKLELSSRGDLADYARTALRD